jgi:hypothetical protein
MEHSWYAVVVLWSHSFCVQISHEFVVAIIVYKIDHWFLFYIAYIISHRIQCYFFLSCCPCFLTCILCIGVGKTRGIQRKGKSEPAAILWLLDYRRCVNAMERSLVYAYQKAPITLLFLLYLSHPKLMHINSFTNAHILSLLQIVSF